MGYSITANVPVILAVGDITYPFEFVCAASLLLCLILFGELIIAWWWTRQRSRDGFRLVLCLTGLSLGLPFLRFWRGYLTILIFGDLVVDSPWPRRVVGLVCVVGYVVLLFAMTKILLRKWRELRVPPLRCPSCGGVIEERGSCNCSECGRPYEVGARYEVRFQR